MTRRDVRMTRRTLARTTAVVSAGLAAGIPAGRAVLAQGATPVASGLPPLPEGAILVADGLWNPRFIVITDDGTLYVTENGIGGDEPIAMPGAGTGELGTPAAASATPAAEPAQPPPTRGYTGQVTQVLSDGTQTVVATGLASYSTGTGPVGMTIANGEIFFDVGGGALEMGIDPLEGENCVFRLNPADGTVEQLADIGQYEADNNPDGTDVNSNLYGMATAADGRLLVADAGGNVIYTVDPATGAFEILTVVGELATAPGRQAVPTDVAVAGDTTLIGLLSLGWPEGAPSLLELGADGTLSAIAGALAFNVALAIGPDGHLYATELFSGPNEGEGPGRVVRVYADGTVEPVVENVMMPHGIAFDVAGNIYLAINSLMSGPGMAAGQVIRIDGIAAAG